jgi:hypothetical protein
MGTVDPKKSLKMMQYVLGQIPGIMRRLHLGVLDGMQLVWLLASAYARELKSKATNEVRTLTPATRESLKLADFFMTRLIKTFSIEGKEYLDEAIRFFEAGGKVLILSNHFGVIDALVSRFILESIFGKKYMMIWIAGKRVWESIFLRIFSRGVNLLTMYSTKYFSSAATDEERGKIRAHNFAMLREMGKRRAIYLGYPQGAWNPEGLTLGDPAAMALVGALGGKKYEGVLVLPMYIDGTDQMVTYSSSPSEDPSAFYRFLEGLTPCKVTLRFSQPLCGDVFRGRSKEDNMETIMRAIAGLAPPSKRGPYASILH